MYSTAEEKERDDKIIGEKTHRFYIGNYTSPKRLGEDIKVFSRFGYYGEIKNVTGYGLFSSKYGILVEPSLNLIFSQGDPNNHDYISDAGTLSVGFRGEMKLKPGYEKCQIYGPGAYYYPDQKVISDIKYTEALEVLKYAIEKSNGEIIEPITPEELYDVVSKVRGLEEEKNNGRKL